MYYTVIEMEKVNFPAEKVLHHKAFAVVRWVRSDLVKNAEVMR